MLLNRNIYSRKYTKVNTNSDDNLHLEKTVNMHNVIIFIKFFFNENHHHYYYKVFLEKFSYHYLKNANL